MMEILISVEGADNPAVLESLHDWLRGDPDLGASVRQRKQPPSQGQLGSMTDALTVAVGAGGGLSVLASALRVWLQQPRHSRVKIRLETGDKGHRILNIDADRVRAEDMRTLLKTLEEPKL
jgi:Effector Associated Constant Component 1